MFLALSNREHRAFKAEAESDINRIGSCLGGHLKISREQKIRDLQQKAAANVNALRSQAEMQKWNINPVKTATNAIAFVLSYMF